MTEDMTGGARLRLAYRNRPLVATALLLALSSASFCQQTDAFTYKSAVRSSCRGQHDTSTFSKDFGAPIVSSSSAAMRSHLFRTGRRETKLLSTPSMVSSSIHHRFRTSPLGYGTERLVDFLSLFRVTFVLTLFSDIVPRQPMSNLAIRLDEPLLSPASIRRPSSAEMFKYVAGVFLTDAFKFAIVAFFIAFVTSVLTQSDASSNSPQSIWEKLSGGFTSLYRFVRAPFSRLADSIAARRAAAGIGPPVPMTFDNESGWGVCTYLGGEPVRKSGYVRHDFSLPEKDNVVPLSLGQNVALCSLDNHDNVVQGEFYPYSKRNLQGKLSILLPAGDDVETELGRDRSNFVSQDNAFTMSTVLRYSNLFFSD